MKWPLKAALSNSFGFGGHNVCLAVAPLDECVGKRNSSPLFYTVLSGESSEAKTRLLAANSSRQTRP